MAKRMQGQSEENRIVAKSRPTAMNLTSSVPTCSSSVNSPNASKSRGILKASSRQVGLSGRPDASTHQNSNPDAASSSPGWQWDAQLFISTGKPVATEHQGCSRNSEVPEDSEGSELESRIWPHHFRTSPNDVDHMEKVFLIIRNTFVRKPTDDLTDLDVNTAISGIFFMSVTLQDAVHLGQDYSQNLRSIKNQPLKSVKQLFRTTEKLIKDQVEITGLSTINWDQPMWTEPSLLCDRAVRNMKSKSYVFSDSVSCLGGISPEPL